MCFCTIEVHMLNPEKIIWKITYFRKVGWTQVYVTVTTIQCFYKSCLSDNLIILALARLENTARVRNIIKTRMERFIEAMPSRKQCFNSWLAISWKRNLQIPSDCDISISVSITLLCLSSILLHVLWIKGSCIQVGLLHGL